MIDPDDELSAVRDIARRAAVLVRWFSRADVPLLELSDRERQAMDRDAEALADALRRAGHYREGWGEWRDRNGHQPRAR